MKSVKRKFPPELINRLDDLLVFTPIGRQDLISIVDLLIHSVEIRLQEAQQTKERPLDICIELEPDARDHIVDSSYEAAFGVRPLRRYIEREIVTSLATAMVKGHLGESNTVHIGVQSVEQDGHFEDKLNVQIKSIGKPAPRTQGAKL